MPWIDQIKLVSEHNLIIGNAPEAVNLSEVISKHYPGMDMVSMGFFDTAAPNFSNYYPGVQASDLQPKDDEFVYPIFRALSEVTVHKGWNPVDFGQNGVLKKSLSMLKGQTVYPNHEAIVGNELGAVAEVSWEESYKDSGITIPAGINAKLKLDGKSNPKIVRAVQMNPPAVHSTSVTVKFLWEKSHAELTEEEFWRKLGSFDSEGKMIRRIATKILGYNEISLVSKGADPFAQKKTKDGGINNPKEAHDRDSVKFKMEQKYFTFSPIEVIQNEEDEHTIPENFNDNENNEDMNKKFLMALATTMGLTANGTAYTEDTITEQIIQDATTALQARVTNESALIAAGATTVEEVTRLKGIETAYNKIKDVKVTELQSFQESTTTQLRNQTTANYNKLMDGKPNDAILNMIKDASYTVLQGLNTQYEQQLEAKFPLKCKDCSSTNVDRGSAAKPEEETSDNRTADQKLQDVIKQKAKAASIKFIPEAETAEK